MRLSRAAIGAAIVLTMTLTRSVSASIVTANVTIDLTTAISGATWTGYAHPLASVVNVNTGDTVEINIGFSPGQALTWSSNGRFNPWLMLLGYPGPHNPLQEGHFDWFDTSVTFLGLTQGTQLPSSQFIDGNNGVLHLGPTNTLGSDNILRTFTGAQVTFTATFLDSLVTRSYGTIGYQDTRLFGGTVSVTRIDAAVPEVTSLLTWATIATTALGGVFIRRRRSAAGRPC